jgi:hypothetical protein
MRKVIVISGIVVLVAAAAFLAIKYFPIKSDQPVIQTFSGKQNPAFKAVPQKSPLIIEVKNQEGLFNLIKGDTPAFAELRGIKEFDDLFSNINNFRDFVGAHSGISNLLKGKSIVISINPSGKNQLSSLFLVQLNDQSESSQATQTVSNELGSAYTITRRNYDTTPIIGAKSDKLSFYFACTNDIFIVSEDFILVEEAIRHANSQNLLNNYEFTEVYKTIEETALANIFINYATIHQVLARIVSPEIKKIITQFTSYSSWTNLDLTNSAQIQLNGYSFTKDSSDNFLTIFREQEAQKMTIEKVIPANAAFFVALNLKNKDSFIDRYESYLKANDQYYPREMNLIEFKKKTNTDPVKLIKEIAGIQFAGVYTNINKSNPTQNRFFVAEIINQSVAKEKLKKAVAEYGKSNKTTGNLVYSEYKVAGKKTFEIYQLPFRNMAESLFGRSFSGILGDYFVVYDKYLIWGDNLPGLKNYIQNLVTEKTMANDSIFKEYIHERPSNPNFYLYAKVPKVFRLKSDFLKPEISDMLSENEGIIRKFSTFSWQFSVSDNMIKNQINLKYDPNVKEEPQAVWQIKLDDQLANRPTLVLNHKDLSNREVIVYDKQNNVSLINKEGLVLWTVNIPGEIISDIHQIDLYQNNKFQYVFNTRTQLYVIDRMGNKVGKFPLTLKSMASNGVSLVDYGKNKEFRFFIAGEDKKIYAFDRWGKLVQNWTFAGSESLITKPGIRIEVDDKDYLIFSDKQNTYFLDRQGKSRDIPTLPFDHSGNQMYFFNDGNPRLITTNLSGKIYIQHFNGQAEIKEIGKYGANHHFAAIDLNGNGSPEYIFADGKNLLVFAADGKKMFERSFEGTITETPFICSFGPENQKIGIIVGGENKVYFLDKNGSITKGFPLDGNTDFILGKFNDASTWYNLIIGSEGNTLVNYRIE